MPRYWHQYSDGYRVGTNDFTPLGTSLFVFSLFARCNLSIQAQFMKICYKDAKSENTARRLSLSSQISNGRLNGEILMKPVSKLVLALALGAFTIAPAAHAKSKKQKKKEAEAAAAAAAAGPKLSKEFIKGYAPAVKEFATTKNYEAAKAAWPAAKAAIQSDDDKYQAGIFAVQLAAKLKDNALRDEGYDLLIESSYTPAETRNSVLFQRAAASYDARDFPAAETKLTSLYNAGYRQSDIELLIATALGQQKKYGAAIGWLQRAADENQAAGKATSVDYYRRAANYSLKLGDPAITNKWMKGLIKADPSIDNWHDALSLYMRKANLTEAETLDVMRLMRRNSAMKYPLEYDLYMESIGSRRYPVEALAVLDEGLASGIIEKSDPNISNHYKTAASLADEDRRTLASTEADARSSPSGNVILLIADSFLSQRKFDTAASLYELALSKGPIRNKDGEDRTDRARMRLAMAKAAQSDWAGAKAEFAKINSGKRKDIAEYWWIYIDQQIAKATAPQTAPAPTETSAPAT